MSLPRKRKKIVAYQVIITTQYDRKVLYITQTQKWIKLRIVNHKSTFSDQIKRNITGLSMNIGQLKRNRDNYTIDWKLPADAHRN